MEQQLSVEATSRSETPTTPNEIQVMFDLIVFKSYLAALLELLLGASESSVIACTSASTFAARARHWATDPSASALYIIKSRVPSSTPALADNADEMVDGSAALSEPGERILVYPIASAFMTNRLGNARAESARIRYDLVSVLTYSPLQMATLSIIKHVPILDTTHPLSDQLHVVNLFGPAATSAPTSTSALQLTLPTLHDSAEMTVTGPGVYQGLHRLLHYAVAPAFEAFVESKTKSGSSATRRRPDEGKESDSKLGIPMTKRKFAELELSLLHCSSSFLCFSSAAVLLTQKCAFPSATECRDSRYCAVDSPCCGSRRRCSSRSPFSSFRRLYRLNPARRLWLSQQAPGRGQQLDQGDTERD